MDISVILTDLSTKLPALQYLLRPEYTPYFNTAGTVLLGWMMVCWFLNLFWTILAPLVISFVAIVIICPTTFYWIFNQFSPTSDAILEAIFQKFQTLSPVK